MAANEKKKMYALVALSISSFPFQRGALLRSGDATAHDERTNERTTLLLFFFSLFFPGCCVGGVIRDEFVCVAKSLSFFLSFFFGVL